MTIARCARRRARACRGRRARRPPSGTRIEQTNRAKSMAAFALRQRVVSELFVRADRRQGRALLAVDVDGWRVRGIRRALRGRARLEGEVASDDGGSNKARIDI